MKFNHVIISTTGLALCAALQLAAQDNASAPRNAAAVSNGRPAVSAANWGRSDVVIGADVIDSHGVNTAGKVRDIIVDLSSGRIAEVMVDVGGYPVARENVAALAPAACSYDPAARALRVNVGWMTLKTLPTFTLSKWKEATEASVAEVYQRSGMTAPQFGTLERATEIKGQAIRNDEGKKLGEVDSLVLDVPAGRIVKVIVASGETPDELTAFSPAAFRYDSSQNMLTLKATEDALRAAPHFKSDEWRSGVNEVAAVPEINTTISRNNTAPDQASELDNIITTEIQQKIQATDGLSPGARAVEVITRNNHVTLRGMVATMREKLQIGDIAAQVVPANNVDNQIEVRDVAISGG